MAKRQDLTGQRFGRLTVIGFSHTDNCGRSYWRCLCDCGGENTVRRDALTRKQSQSCGCYNKESATTHDMSDTNIYYVWRSILTRCYDKKSNTFKYYGGRGIKVSDEWNSFELFFRDMGMPPSKEHQIDRIDNDGDYSKNNCRWVTRGEQCRNRRSNRMLTHNNKTQCLLDWAVELGIKRETLQSRLARGWPVTKTLTQPVMKN